MPRRPPKSPSDPFPPFDPVPPVRVLSQVSARRDEKAIFDALQTWLSFREGRAIHQWEAFGIVLYAAFTGDRSKLEGFHLPSFPSQP